MTNNSKSDENGERLKNKKTLGPSVCRAIQVENQCLGRFSWHRKNIPTGNDELEGENKVSYLYMDWNVLDNDAYILCVFR